MAPIGLILFVLILLYIWIFAGLAFGQHAGMRTHKADLGQIDQAVWNSSRGRFVEMTDNGYVSTRLIDHVEPILALISPGVLGVERRAGDSVAAGRVCGDRGVAAVRTGAAPIGELCCPQVSGTRVWLAEPVQALAGLVALALAVAYLLTPQLQSAVLTEFHAIPLATPLILWSFWAIATGAWRQFAVATVLVALVKEEAALLAAGLGVWAMWRIVWEMWAATRRGGNGEPSAFPVGPLALAAGDRRRRSPGSMWRPS